MNHYEALQLLALRAVEKPDGEARLRGICRWYSKTFHTPLHVVEELDEDDVLTAYFESIYEEMEESERQDIMRQLLETDEQKAARARARDEEAAESFEFARRMADEARIAAAKKKISDVKEVVRPASTLSAPARLVTKALSEVEKLEPDVSVRFVDPIAFEKELEGFGEMGPKKAK